MKQQRLLCIGGPEHGRRVNAPTTRHTIRFPVVREARVDWRRAYEGPDPLGEIDTVEYRRQKFYLSGRDVPFLAHVGTPLIEIEALVFDYLASALAGESIG